MAFFGGCGDGLSIIKTVCVEKYFHRNDVEFDSNGSRF
jgi:hypothetical protein